MANRNTLETGRGFVRRLIAIAVTALGIALVTGAAVSLSMSPDAVRGEVTGRLAALSGQDVQVSGETELRLFPSPRFTIFDVRLSAPRSGGGAELGRIEAMTGSIALLPLVVGRIEVAGLSLVRPRFALEIDATGRHDWESGAGGLIGQALASPDAVPADATGIGDIRIEGGHVRYVDDRDGTRHEIEDINATLSWPDLAAPMAGSGRLVWSGEQVSFSFEARQPFSFLGRGSSAARLSIRSPRLNLSFSGDAHLTDNAHIHGRLALSTPSTRQLLRDLGTDLGPGRGLEDLALSGQISLLANTAIISELSMTLDGNRAEGSLKVDIEDDRIELQGTLAFDTLDLNPYLPAATDRGSSAEAAVAKTSPIDLADLAKVVADLRMSADRVAVGQLRLGETAGTVTVRDGALTLGIAQAALHGGTAMGTVAVAPHETGFAARVNASIDHFAVAGMLADVGLPQQVEGTAQGSATLNGRGRTVDDILASLSGEVRLSVSGGALLGADLAAALDALDAAQVIDWSRGSEMRTSFDRLSATLRVADGVATTPDLQLLGPQIELSLTADIQLADATLTGRGTLARTASHDPGDDDLAFLVEGPLAALRIRVDPLSLLSRPALGGTPPEELIERLLERAP